MSAERVAVGFTSPAGEELAVTWDEAALAALDPDADPPWRLEGELDWDAIEAVRVLSARIDDGRALAVASLRPAGAAGHGDEAAGGAILAEGEVESLAEVLLSTEYGPGEEPRRVGLELYPEAEGMPLRLAGDATGHETEVDGAIRRRRTTLALRLTGIEGRGVYEILTRV